MFRPVTAKWRNPLLSEVFVSHASIDQSVVPRVLPLFYVNPFSLPAFWFFVERQWPGNLSFRHLEVLPSGAKSDDCRVTQIKSLKTPNKISRRRTPSRPGRIARKNSGRRSWSRPGFGPSQRSAIFMAEVYEKKEHSDYTVEKVLSRTYPGYYATGNLYRPVQRGDAMKKYPGILCPHGHGKGAFGGLGPCLGSAATSSRNRVCLFHLRHGRIRRQPGTPSA